MCDYIPTHQHTHTDTDFIYLLLDVFLKGNAILSVICYLFLLVIIPLNFPSHFDLLLFYIQSFFFSHFIFSHFSIVTELCIEFELGVLYFFNWKMRYDSCLFLTGSGHTLLMVYLLDEVMPVHVTNRNKNVNYCCSMNSNSIVFDIPLLKGNLKYLNESMVMPSAIEKSNPTCTNCCLKFVRVRINFSNLYHEKFYDKNWLVLASPKRPLRLSLMGRKFYNFAGCRLLESPISNVS